MFSVWRNDVIFRESVQIPKNPITVTWSRSYWYLTWYLLIYLSRCLDQKTAKWTFQFSSQATTCFYQSNHSKVEAIPLGALPKDATSELAVLSSYYFFNAGCVSIIVFIPFFTWYDPDDIYASESRLMFFK